MQLNQYMMRCSLCRAPMNAERPACGRRSVRWAWRVTREGARAVRHVYKYSMQTAVSLTERGESGAVGDSAD